MPFGRFLLNYVVLIMFSVIKQTGFVV